MPRLKLLPWAAATAIGLGSASAHAAFTIQLNLGDMAPAYQTYFQQAKTFWEGVITGYLDDVGLTGVTIAASIKAVDGQRVPWARPVRHSAACSAASRWRRPAR